MSWRCRCSNPNKYDQKESSILGKKAKHYVLIAFIHAYSEGKDSIPGDTNQEKTQDCHLYPVHHAQNRVLAQEKLLSPLSAPEHQYSVVSEEEVATRTVSQQGADFMSNTTWEISSLWTLLKKRDWWQEVDQV